MKLILILLMMWAANMSAQTIVIQTNYVVISNEYCDMTVAQFDVDCNITIVGSVMTLKQGGNPADIIRVLYVESNYNEDGVWYIYEHETGYVYVNIDIPYVTIEDEAGCVDYFNHQ